MTLATETTSSSDGQGTPLRDAASVRRAVQAFIEEFYDPEISVSLWLERLADSGWAKPTWPVEWFGRGLSSGLAAVAFGEFARVGAPGPPRGLGVMLAAPTIIDHASQEVKRRFIRAVLVGDHAWCQLFSEPGAGSDLAGLQTRAVRDGDHFVVNGQKVWTSAAADADLGMLLARTDSQVAKHRGITYFAIDMDQPGVEVRPLRQITGDAQFSEVFMTDAHVPVENVIGEINDGWSVALTTLRHERVGLGGEAGLGFLRSAPGGRRAQSLREVSVREFMATSHREARAGAGGAAMIAGNIDPLLRLATSLGRQNDPLVRQRLVRLYTLTTLNRLNTLRGRAAVRAGSQAGAETSLGKLMASEIARNWRDTASEISGPLSMLAGPDAPMRGLVASQLLATPAPAIYGGSDQIQRNVIGERVLGLPREPDASKNVPFRELLVGTLTSNSGTDQEREQA